MSSAGIVESVEKSHLTRPPDCSVIVVSYNTRALLAKCLASVQVGAQSGHTVEVLVVDNASSDESAKLVAEAFPGVLLIQNEANLGFAAATNQGLARAGGRHLVLLNPDTEVQEGALSVLVDFLDSHPEAGVVGPQFIHPDSSLQSGAFRFPTLAMALLDQFPVHHRLMGSRWNGRYPNGCNAPFPIDHPLGACLMVRAEVLQNVGTLDEGFFMYCEEVDWCMRIKAAGWQIFCEPRSRILHRGGASTAQFRERMFIELFRSRRRLFAKHYSAGYQAAASAIVRAGMWKAARKAGRAYARGEITDAERERRSATYATVGRIG